MTHLKYYWTPILLVFAVLLYSCGNLPGSGLNRGSIQLNLNFGATRAVATNMPVPEKVILEMLDLDNPTSTKSWTLETKTQESSFLIKKPIYGPHIKIIFSGYSVLGNRIVYGETTQKISEKTPNKVLIKLKQITSPLVLDFAVSEALLYRNNIKRMLIHMEDLDIADLRLLDKNSKTWTFAYSDPAAFTNLKIARPIRGASTRISILAFDESVGSKDAVMSAGEIRPLEYSTPEIVIPLKESLTSGQKLSFIIDFGSLGVPHLSTEANAPANAYLISRLEFAVEKTNSELPRNPFNYVLMGSSEPAYDFTFKQLGNKLIVELSDIFIGSEASPGNFEQSMTIRLRGKTTTLIEKELSNIKILRDPKTRYISLD